MVAHEGCSDDRAHREHREVHRMVEVAGLVIVGREGANDKDQDTGGCDSGNQRRNRAVFSRRCGGRGAVGSIANHVAGW